MKKLIVLILVSLLAFTLPAQNYTLTGTKTYSNKILTVDTVTILGNITLSNVELTASRIFIGVGGSLTLNDSILIKLRPKGEIMSMRGQFIVNGENKQAFVNTTTTINTGTSTVTLSEIPRGWNVGDSIVLAPSYFDPLETEWKKITNISGTTLTFQPAASHTHLAGAEVANTSRSIKITGTTKTSGWHLMLMNATHTEVTGLEMAYGGVEGEFGKYPFHWHFAGDLPGSFIKASSVHHSQQRGYTVHGTNYTIVENNVLFDYKNHGFIIGEDGFSHDNIIDSNITLLGRVPTIFAFPETNDNLTNARTSGGSSQSEKMPGAIWETGYANTFRHNVLAGGFGNGFFVDRSMGRPDYVFEVFKGDPSIYQDMVIHSYNRTNAYDGFGQFTAYRTQGNGFLVDQFNTNKLQIARDITIYNCRGGIWSETDSMSFDNIKIDNVSYGAALFKGQIHNSTINKGTGLENTGGVILQSSEGSLRAQKGSIALDNVQFTGFNVMFNVKDDFEGPAYLKNVTNTGTRLSFSTSFKGTLFDMDNMQVYVNGNIANSATNFYIADDVEQCTSFNPGSGWYTKQEGSSWWTNCTSYPWVINTHWVKASLSESMPAGADRLKVYNWENTYGVEPLSLERIMESKKQLYLKFENESPIFYIK